MWETQRLARLIYDPDSRFAGLVYFYDSDGERQILEVSGPLLPTVRRTVSRRQRRRFGKTHRDTMAANGMRVLAPTLLALLLLSLPVGQAFAHGGVSVEDDQCILTAGLYRGAFHRLPADGPGIAGILRGYSGCRPGDHRRRFH